MTTETLTKTQLRPGTQVRVTNPRQIKQDLKGQIFEVVEMTTDEAFKAYRNDAAADWELICKGEKFARPTWILERSEVEVYSAGFPSPALIYREGDRVVENLNTENVQLDSLIRHGTFVDYRRMDGAGKSLYPFVRWDDGTESYSNEDTLERSDKPAPTTAEADSRSPSTLEEVAPTDEPEAATVEIVPSDPADRLIQINTQLQDGERLAREGQRLILSAIAQILNEPEILEASEYTSIHDWLERQHGWQRTYRYTAIKAAKAYSSVSGKVEALPDSINVFDALGSVAEAERVEILEQAGGAFATADSIKAAANPSATVNELPIYRPDSSPEAIREGIEAGYIQPTAAAPLSAEGKPILIDDCIAYAANPTELIGRVTAYAPGGRVEYTRFKKTLYIDAAVVVHQQSVASPHPAPRPVASPATDAQTTTETPEAVTGDFERGSVVRVRGTQTHYCIARVVGAECEMWAYSETLWARLDEIEVVTAPSPLTLEDIARDRLKKLAKVLGGKAVADMALDQCNLDEARQIYAEICPTEAP